MHTAVDAIKTSMVRQGRRNLPTGPFPNHQVLPQIRTIRGTPDIKGFIHYQPRSNSASPPHQQTRGSYNSSSPSSPHRESTDVFNSRDTNEVFLEDKMDVSNTHKDSLLRKVYRRNGFHDENNKLSRPRFHSDLELTSLDNKRRFLQYGSSFSSAIDERPYSNTLGNGGSDNNNNHHELQTIRLNSRSNERDVSPEQYTFHNRDQLMKDYDEMRRRVSLPCEIKPKSSLEDSDICDSYGSSRKRPHTSHEYVIQANQQSLYERRRNPSLDIDIKTNSRLINTSNEYIDLNAHSKFYASSPLIKPAIIKLSEALGSLSDAKLESDQSKKYYSPAITKSEGRYFTFPERDSSRTEHKLTPQSHSCSPPRTSMELSTYQPPPGYVLRKYVPLVDVSTQTTQITEVCTSSVITSRKELLKATDTNFRNGLVTNISDVAKSNLNKCVSEELENEMSVTLKSQTFSPAESSRNSNHSPSSGNLKINEVVAQSCNCGCIDLQNKIPFHNGTAVVYQHEIY